MPLQLGVLDQSPIPDGLTSGDALRNSIDLAAFTESLGYRRYWVAEHHGSIGLACNSPEVLIGPIAAATSSIRVGSGGIMLPHYSPLKVVESFQMLSSMYPSRIDLGIGRAAGTSAKIAHALQRDRRHTPPDDFPEQLAEVLSTFQKLSANAVPEVSLLGSSPQSALWAAELGLPYVFADFINPDGESIAALYRDRFQPSIYLRQPHTTVALWAIAADTDEEASRLSQSVRMMLTMLFRGRSISVPTVERAEQFIRDEGVPMEMLAAGRRFITGSPATAGAAIRSVAADYGADEVLLVNILHSHTARRRSYELVAREFGLSEILVPHGDFSSVAGRDPYPRNAVPGR